MLGCIGGEKKTQLAQGRLDLSGLGRAATWGGKRPDCGQPQDSAVKKTQLGPGSTHVESAWENCCEGETDRPADQSETGAVRERRSPTKSSQDSVLGEAATQPRDGCAAGMGKGQGSGRTPTEVFRLYEPASEEQSSTPQPTHAAEWRLSLRGDLRESEAQSFRSDPWAAVRRARLDPMQPVPDSVDGNPPGF